MKSSSNVMNDLLSHLINCFKLEQVLLLLELIHHLGEVGQLALICLLLECLLLLQFSLDFSLLLLP
jgi:hypothetical protein